MKKLLVHLLLLPAALTATGQIKKSYDLDSPPTDQVRFLKGQTAVADHKIKNSQIEAALLSSGYFTLGTTGGTEGTDLDDACPITFGHPWAKTSYPVFEWGGIQLTPESLAGTCVTETVTGTDSASVIFLKENDFKAEFTIRISGGTASLISRIQNLSGQVQTVAPGLILDPSVGKWADGTLFSGQEGLGKETLLGPDFPFALELREKSAAPFGMVAGISFPGAAPAELQVINWKNLLAGEPANTGALLYDVCLKASWPLSLLNAGDSKETRTLITLKQPDFGQLFLRWDLEPFSSIQGGLLTPSTATTWIEVSNPGAQSQFNLTLGLNGGTVFPNDTSSVSFAIAPNQKSYQKLTVSIPEIYDNQTSPLVLSLYQNSTKKLTENRNYFIPATPVSETGLTVKIDTVTASGNDLSVFFKARITETDQLLTNLKPSNLKLTGNQNRVFDFTLLKDTTGGVTDLDLVFVLDVTGSMSEEIQAVKNNMIEFTDSIANQGISYRLALVTFGDEVRSTSSFTTDAGAFKTLIGQQTANGGADFPENSLDALAAATELNFKPNAKKVIIWITDATYHIANSITPLTIQQVVNQLVSKAIVVNCIGPTAYATSYYDPIVLPTGGSFYDILGKFRDILLDISRMTTPTRFKLVFTSKDPVSPGYVTELSVYYSGLGGHDQFTLNSGGLQKAQAGVTLYPNPFNPTATISVRNPQKYGLQIEVFNLLGQSVRQFELAPGSPESRVIWNADNSAGQQIATGIYLIQVRFLDATGKVIRKQTEKLYFLK